MPVAASSVSATRLPVADGFTPAGLLSMLAGLVDIASSVGLYVDDPETEAVFSGYKRRSIPSWGGIVALPNGGYEQSGGDVTWGFNTEERIAITGWVLYDLIGRPLYHRAFPGHANVFGLDDQITVVPTIALIPAKAGAHGR